jgi:hypothetical protein
LIEDRTDHCVDVIHRRCRSCVRRLERLQAPELARRLRDMCMDVVDNVRRVERRSIGAIKSQFDQI